MCLPDGSRVDTRDVLKLCTGLPVLSIHSPDNIIQVKISKSYKTPFANTCTQTLNLPFLPLLGDMEAVWVGALDQHKRFPFFTDA